MALNIGAIAERDHSHDTLARSRARAALIPDLLVEAGRIASNVTAGWHGRRKRGSGDNFWQFRPYDPGETLARIDWRRSARDDHVYVRDQEWEAAHTVWVWADESPSMLYKSDAGTVAKQSRAFVLAFALCEVLARSGERIGWPGITRAFSARNAAERIATALMQPNVPTPDFPPLHDIKAHSDIVLFSDFLDPIGDVMGRMDDVAQQGIRGSLVQIIDPAEEAFPYVGRTEFRDPESGRRFTAGRAETLSVEYRNIFEARKKAISVHAKRLGWNHIVHHTDRLASEALVALHVRLSGNLADPIKGAA